MRVQDQTTTQQGRRQEGRRKTDQAQKQKIQILEQFRSSSPSQEKNMVDPDFLNEKGIS